MKIVRTRSDLATARLALVGPVGLVPTMGALHAGHRALMDTARGECASVLATIFVNPTQFGPTEDLARYPRTPEADLAICEDAGVDLVWAPTVEDVYAAGDPLVTVDPGSLAAQLDGITRPTHFAGVLTIVAKLLGNTRPDRAYFGEKDYQQLTLIRRMATDLDFAAAIVGVPTVRESDGLALSSRNVYLSVDGREQALGLSRALFAGRDAAPAGADAVLTAARVVLDEHPGLDVEYLELRSADLGPPGTGESRLLVAGKVGSTRLIDNVAVQL